MDLLRPAEDACLLIADITGYTGYLAATELEHAQDVIAAFIETVIVALEPTFQVVGTEGDAVFVMAPLDGLEGQLVLDIVDACYFAFRRHSRNVTLATTCECNACRQIPTLDLKFVVHSGPVVRSTMARRETVAGPAAIVIHRLLKNSVNERFGSHAYLLITEEAVRTLHLDQGALLCSRSVESYEHLGDVPTLVVDMERRWQLADAASGSRVDRDSAVMAFDLVLPAPPPVVWEYLSEPSKRRSWKVNITGIDEEGSAGRRDIGTTVHCRHGGSEVLQHIIEWRPFETLTWDCAMPGMGRFRNTLALEAIPEGTLLHDLCGLLPVSEGGLSKEVLAMFAEPIHADYVTLDAILAGRSEGSKGRS